MGMTNRQTVTRLCEHGTTKDTFNPPANHIDVVEPINVRQQTRSSSNTKTSAKAQQTEPPLRRSSRIRNRTIALATTVTKTNDDRQSVHVTTDQKKNVDTSSSIAEHEETTGHHMD